MSETVFNAQELVSQLTMTVRITGMRSFRIKRWLAVRLLWLATRILGCGLEVLDA